MTTIAIFGGTGYAGSAIRDEALKRGHRVISVTRNLPADTAAAPGLEFRQGSVHDAALVDQVAAEADVIVVSIRFAPGASDDTGNLTSGVQRYAAIKFCSPPMEYGTNA